MNAPRIASLLASSTEILHGLGLWDRVVAVSHECDYPPGVADKPRVTLTTIHAAASSKTIDAQVRAASADHEPLYKIDTQALAKQKPDLIVTQAQCDVCAVKYEDVLAAVRSEPSLHATRIVALNPNSLDDIFQDIAKVGEAAGVGDQAERFIAILRARVSAVEDATADLDHADRPRVVCVEWIDPVMLAANWMPDLLRLAGARCDLVQAGTPSSDTPWTDVVTYDPEVIVVMPCGFDLQRTIEESRTLTGLDHWAEITAVRQGLVYAVDGNAYFNRSGPRIVDSLEILAALVHPDRFPDHRATYKHAWAELIG
ncbi:MAG: cobalamin-binding protein [Planctomycetes bacterium]|nr:cobalamin-binding protein [Planctomycetota bacterium]